MKKFIYLIVLILSSGSLSAQTFSKDIAPIIYNQCTVCHRTGEIGPMTLTNYDEVKNYAQTIKYVTSTGYMPPWQADPEYTRFLGENYLTEAQKTLIANWVDAGAPQGDPADEPPLPDFPSGSLLGTPDLVLTMSEAHLHPGDNKDEYRYFVLPSGLTEDKVIKAMELRAGNPKIVHHALIFEDTNGEAAASDALTPEYGFEGFGGFSGGDIEDVLAQKQYPGYVPGQKPIFYPDGLGQTLAAGADVVVQMHYAPWPVDTEDQSSINIFFADANEVVDRIVKDHIMVPAPGVLDTPFFILGNQVKTFTGEWTVPNDVSFIGLSPHMHLLGQDWEVYIQHQNGTQTKMISIPEWDFNWQGGYYFPKLLVAKAGDKIIAKATYDNTAENPNNPNSPPTFITWGENTSDEMYYLPLFYVDYEDGDENVVFDSTLGLKDHNIAFDKNTLSAIAPNPVNGMVNVNFSLGRGTSVNVQILDINGQIVRTVKNKEFYSIGDHIINFQSDNLSAGTYILKLEGSDFLMSEKFVKL